MKVILTKQTRKFIMDFFKSYPLCFFAVRWLLVSYFVFYLIKSVVLDEGKFKGAHHVVSGN